jgi:hypothetical protein
LSYFVFILEKKGKPKRTRAKQPESTKKDEDELRKEKRKSDAAKKAEAAAAPEIKEPSDLPNSKL